MQPFLNHIIDRLLGNSDIPLHDVAVVLPNRRARRRLLQGLHEANGGKAMFAPQIFPMEAKLDAERIYWFTKLAILEYLSTGCTAAFDMYFELDAYVRACTESGFRCVMCSADSGDEKALTAIEDAFLKYNKPDRPFVKYIPGLHAEYTCSKELISGIGELARKYKTPIPSSTHKCLKLYICLETNLVLKTNMTIGRIMMKVERVKIKTTHNKKIENGGTH